LSIGATAATAVIEAWRAVALVSETFSVSHEVIVKAKAPMNKSKDFDVIFFVDLGLLK
jgi:hypothetical protein